MRMKRIVLTFIPLLALLACEPEPFKIYPPDELGAVEKTFEVEASAGSVTVPVYANAHGSVTASESWISLDKFEFDADFDLGVSYSANSGIPRRSSVFLETATRRDTVTIFQKGAIEELFHLKTTSLIVYNGTGSTSVPLDINVPLEQVNTDVRYMNGEGWLSNCKLDNTSLSFTTADNTDPVNMRRALVVLSYTDGWGELREERVTVIQPRMDNSVGTVFTAEQMRALATIDGYELPDDAFFEGYIVGTTEDSNAGALQVEDYEQGTGVIEYNLDQTTNYIESTDGRFGFRILTDNPDDNDFRRDTKVGLLLGGARISRSATEPYCYTISGVSSMMIMTAADEQPPLKECSIADLTDDDIFTSVILKDCEIPMRKGPFTPINEGYGNACGYNFVAKHAQLIRDRKGGSMYMFINMKCPWRRDGKPMPSGSGNIRGVVVSEPFPAFGHMSRYQIRPLTRADLALKESFADSFSGLVTEFRWAKVPEEGQATELPGAILATCGNGEMTHTYSGYTGWESSRFGNFSPTYMYLGPCGTKLKNKWENLVGIILEDGTPYNPIPEGAEGDQNTDGKGFFAASCRLSWSNKYWWDSSANEGYAYLVKCSTEGISSDLASLQFAMYNNSQSLRSPRYWKAQYAVDSAGEDWKDIGNFTVADVAIWANRYEWQTVGTQVFDFPLPSEVLGQKTLWIRLMPRNNKAGTKSPDGYDSSTINNNSGYNTMDYFAIRYNK